MWVYVIDLSVDKPYHRTCMEHTHNSPHIHVKDSLCNKYKEILF